MGHKKLSTIWGIEEETIRSLILQYKFHCVDAESKLYKSLSQFFTVSTGKEYSSIFEILYIKILIGLSTSKTKSEGWECF